MENPVTYFKTIWSWNKKMIRYHFPWIFQKIRSPFWVISIPGRKQGVSGASLKLASSLFPVINSPPQNHSLYQLLHRKGTSECKLWTKRLYLVGFLEFFLFQLKLTVVKCTRPRTFRRHHPACNVQLLRDAQLHFQVLFSILLLHDSGSLLSYELILQV